MYVTELSIWLSSAQERFEEIKRLIKFLNDPPNEPYFSKYAAKSILSELLKDIDNKWKNNCSLQIKLLSELFNYHLGVIAFDTDETSTAYDILVSAWEILKDISGSPESCILTMSILNQLGLVCSALSELEKAKEYLVISEKMYITYKENSLGCPYSFEDLFKMENSSEGSWRIFEHLHTNTLFYLSQAYEHTDDKDESARCCYETLQRLYTSNEYNALEFSLNISNLSWYYVQEKAFQRGKQLLCCASISMNKFENDTENAIEGLDTEVNAEYMKTKAHISLFWVKYCIELLSASNADSSGISKYSNLPQFSDEPNIVEMEMCIPSIITNYESAKKIFLLAQEHIAIATTYYTLNEHASKYIEITQYHCDLYRCLINHEEDNDRQCKMNKRRVDMLETLLKSLNPRYYLRDCRQIQVDLGSIYYEMAELKIKGKKLTTKINSLILKSIHHHKEFIRTVEQSDCSMPKTLPDDLVKSVLFAHYSLGMLYGKLIESNVKKQLENLNESVKFYNYVIDYTNCNPQHVDVVSEELPVIKTMVEFLPQKREILEKM